MSSVPADDGARVPSNHERAEVARELLLDLRAELPRLDARAAAGTTLAGAVLVAVVTQELPHAVYYFGVIAAILLTLALLFFLGVFLPSSSLGHLPPNGPSSGRMGRLVRLTAADEAADTYDLHKYLASVSRDEYYMNAVIRLRKQVDHKSYLLRAAVLIGSAGVLTLALGASFALLIGLR
jgi:hypothetical protein